MKFGMTDQQFDLLEELVLRPLKENGCTVYIFGSRVTSKFHSHSDVDVLYMPTKSLPPAFISNLIETIEDSRFPFRIDLVSEENLAQSYRESVFRSRVLV